MHRPDPSLALLKVLAGEGGYRLYHLLASGRRLFVFLKCARIVLFHTFYNGKINNAETIVLVKGPNQIRLWQRQLQELRDEFGDIGVCAISQIGSHAASGYLPRFSIWLALRQVATLLAMLVTGRRRYLNLFLILFYSSIKSSVDLGFPHVCNVICYNDQPFEVSSIIFALNQRKGTKTIVLQHGLILDKTFYFPTNAREFRAWGELSRQHFYSRHPDGALTVKGRYKKDEVRKSDHFVPVNKSCLAILAATSFRRDDLDQMIDAMRNCMRLLEKEQAVCAIKLHPATKGALWLRWWIRKQLPNILFETDDMEDLAVKYDVLITRNSTSAIDFLLLGKPVVFLEYGRGPFPSLDYGLTLHDLGHGDQIFARASAKEGARARFIKEALNV